MCFKLFSSSGKIAVTYCDNAGMKSLTNFLMEDIFPEAAATAPRLKGTITVLIDMVRTTLKIRAACSF